MICKFQTQLSLVGAGLLALLIAFLRPGAGASEAVDQIVAQRFWLLKAQNNRKYDLVILGDSRAYRGLSPAEMQKSLQPLRIYNFAFSAGGLNPEIYAAAENLLDPRSQCRCVVLGVTPGSLLPTTRNNRQFNEESRRPASAYLERVHLNYHLRAFAPWDLDAGLFRITGKHWKPCQYINKYSDDGWVGANKIPEDPNEALEPYRVEMTRSKVDSGLVQALLSQTRLWTSRGIRVFALRPPASPAMIELENELSGFNESAFVQNFVAAGGTWIPLDPTQYHSYDGSHLAEVSALKLSDHVAGWILRAGLRSSVTSM